MLDRNDFLRSIYGKNIWHGVSVDEILKLEKEIRLEREQEEDADDEEW
tara:strand:+ start:97 stop:240 length:144 start_codon:yes stop_codon:yes gene_type:complete